VHILEQDNVFLTFWYHFPHYLWLLVDNISESQC
jgi:hypothetical protein